MDNLSQQADEVAALVAIYEREWSVLSESARVYAVNVGQHDRQVVLEVRLPDEYPTDAAPHYQLCAPWLRGEKRRQLVAALDELQRKNAGASILYIWIEKIKEFIEDVPTADSSDHAEELEADCVESTAGVRDDGYSTSWPEMTHGQCIVDRKSVFQGHCAVVTSLHQARLMLSRLLENRKIGSATHNMWAMRANGSTTGTFVQDCDDDGETHAGTRLLHLLTILDVRDVLVVVSRWFGGIMLGPDRFRHINNAARTVLEEADMIPASNSTVNRKTHKR